MEYNGMTEEEYLDSLLKQTSDDIPKDEQPESQKSFYEGSESTEEAVEDIAFDFNSLFDNVAEAEDAPAEGHEDVSGEEAEPDPLDAFFSQLEAEAKEEFGEEALKTTEQEYSDFHESLDSIIGELEKKTEDTEADEVDIFSQIDNTELPDEELTQDIDDDTLLEAVGILLDESNDNPYGQSEFGALSEDVIQPKVAEDKKKKDKTKKSFFKKFKAFLVEQGEDTAEDIAAAEAAELAKEEKQQKAEEDKEKKAQAKAERKEKSLQKKNAKKEAKENKALEKQMKKEKKKAEREASGEPKYNVTAVKLAFLFTLVAAFGILLWAVSDYNFRRISKQNAMIHFTADRYEMAYEEIAGMKPQKSEEVFFEQVRTVMYVQKQYDSYLNFYNIGMKEEALDALLKGIDKYDKYYENADDLGILEDMNIVLDKIHSALDEVFYLSADKADAIANIEDAAEYSVALRKVINSIKE